jgi:hypothetical protein
MKSVPNPPIRIPYHSRDFGGHLPNGAHTLIVWPEQLLWAAATVGRANFIDVLDPTEKGAVSYNLGLVVSKLFSEMLLGVPWLLHLDVSLRVAAVTHFSGDLLAFHWKDPEGWMDIPFTPSSPWALPSACSLLSTNRTDASDFVGSKFRKRAGY